jgi:hypothetical protein
MLIALLSFVAFAQAALPDGRGYELVSPSDSGGVPTTLIGSYLDDPSQTRTLLEAPFPIASLGGGDSLQNDYRSTRTNSGWTPTFVGPPAALTANQGHLHYGATNGISHDVNRLIFLSPPFPELGPVTDPSPLWAVDFPNHTLTWISQGNANDTLRDTGYPAARGTRAMGISANGAHVFFAANLSLQPDAAPSGNATIYDRHGDQTYVISKDPTNTPIQAELGPGGNPLDPTPGYRGFAASDDGTTVAFTASTNPTDIAGAVNHVYVRRNDAVTLDASAPTGVDGNPCLVGIGSDNCVHFMGLSSDGSKVFFSTTEQLTVDDTDTSLDIYEYDVPTGVLVRVSTGAGSSGNDPASVFGLTRSILGVIASTVSADGSHVYFLSSELLDPGHGVLGQQNLYVHTDAATRFLTTLAPSDYIGPGQFGVVVGAHYLVAGPGGGDFLLQSSVDRTGFAAGGHAEIYDYSAAAPSGSMPVCLSCNPSGSAGGDASVDGSSLQPGGRFFFTTSDALASGDTNGKQDVYERVPAGLGVPSGFFLISSGQSKQDSSLAAVSPDPQGHDVLFDTSETLVPQDLNGTVTKVYDARSGGGFPVPGSLGCVGVECRGAKSSPPAPPVSSSATLAGSGNAPESDSTSSSKLLRIGSLRINARSGTVELAARVGSGGRLVAHAFATLAGRRVAIGSSSRLLSRAGVTHLRLLLSHPARRALAVHRSLIVRVDVSLGSLKRSARLVLRLPAKR